jgi:hypothetical protein
MDGVLSCGRGGGVVQGEGGMKRVYVTFGGKAYDETTGVIVSRAPGFGANEVRVYDDAWLMTTPFYQINNWLWHTDEDPAFDHRNWGFGWCAWKPYMLMQEMKRLETGDLVLYTDADTYPIADLTPIFELCGREGIVLFEAQGCPNKFWTRRDAYVVMGLGEQAGEEIQACGRFSMFKKGDPRLEQFLAEWLTYATNRECQKLYRSSYTEEFPGFKRHSNEQSVLSLLAIKYGIKPHREACQFGWPISPGCGWPSDTWPQMFHQQDCRGDKRDLSGSIYRNV